VPTAFLYSAAASGADDAAEEARVAAAARARFTVAPAPDSDASASASASGASGLDDFDDVLPGVARGANDAGTFASPRTRRKSNARGASRRMSGVVSGTGTGEEADAVGVVDVDLQMGMGVDAGGGVVEVQRLRRQPSRVVPRAASLVITPATASAVAPLATPTAGAYFTAVTPSSSGAGTPAAVSSVQLEADEQSHIITDALAAAEPTPRALGRQRSGARRLPSLAKLAPFT
jgi:hypothetical protein